METPGEGQVRAVVSVATNPVRSYPNSDRLDRAFAKLDFFVAVDIYVNETTRHADVILPTPSPLAGEQYDLVFYANAIAVGSKGLRPGFNEEIASATPEAGGDASELTLDASESPFDHGRDELTELSLAEEVVDDLLGPGGPVAADAAAAVDELLGEVDRVDSQWGESDRDLRSDLDAPGEALDLGDAPGVELLAEGPVGEDHVRRLYRSASRAASR